MGLKIGLITGGGDAPGLNAVIYGVVRAVEHQLPEAEIIGFHDSFKGIFNKDFIELNQVNTSGILNRGGSMLFSTNRDNPYHWAVGENPDGSKIYGDVSDRVAANLREICDVLVAIGGDGTLTTARDLARKGDVKIIGVPKTIDNDLAATDMTFGFDSAVNVAVENLGRLHTTAEAHHRVLVAEIMGRNAGWLTLYAGIAGSADVILLPEFPYDIDRIIAKIHERDAVDKRFTIIAIGEGARSVNGMQTVSRKVNDALDSVRLGGVAHLLADELQKRIPEDEHEVRHVVFGHTQRGGDASPADRILALRYAIHAVNLIKDSEFNKIVVLKDGQISAVDFDVLTGATEAENQRKVTANAELVQVARNLGIEFGVEF